MTTNLDAQNLPGFSDSYSYSSPVTAEAPNELGILGLGGNVSEWCADVWPGAEAEHVIRGGSWLTADKEKLLTSARRHSPATNSSPDIGFRVVIDQPHELRRSAAGASCEA
jgi:formylglycine-generating enzyme required for sulfatase activity